MTTVALYNLIIRFFTIIILSFLLGLEIKDKKRDEIVIPLIFCLILENLSQLYTTLLILTHSSSF